MSGTVYAVLNEHYFALVVILQSILSGCFHFYGIFANIIILLYNKSLLFKTIFSLVIINFINHLFCKLGIFNFCLANCQCNYNGTYAYKEEAWLHILQCSTNKYSILYWVIIFTDF